MPRFRYGGRCRIIFDFLERRRRLERELTTAAFDLDVEGCAGVFADDALHVVKLSIAWPSIESTTSPV